MNLREQHRRWDRDEGEIREAKFVNKCSEETAKVLINVLTGKVGTGSNLSDRVGRLGLGAFDLGRRLSS